MKVLNLAMTSSRAALKGCSSTIQSYWRSGSNPSAAWAPGFSFFGERIRASSREESWNVWFAISACMVGFNSDWVLGVEVVSEWLGVVWVEECLRGVEVDMVIGG